MPAFFNVLQIQMPVGAVASFAHRISGVLLAIGVPFSVYMFDLSLKGPSGYSEVAAILHSPPMRCLGVLYAWALGHHLLAGVRHLLSDIDIGSSLPKARRSAWIVNCASPLLAVLAAVAFL